jgi:hypothetical protein
MPLSETRQLVDGKAVPGVTVLVDPQTGQEFDVVDVASGRMPTPMDPQGARYGSGERCALSQGAKIHLPRGRS